MTLYALDGVLPRIHASAYVHPDAVVIGDVVVHAEASIWPGAVLRADDAMISVGARTSVQDGTVIHVAEGLPTIIGDDCVVGHNAHLEGCAVEDAALVGSMATVLNGAVLRRGCVVGAGALITESMEVPAGHLAVGVPARVRVMSGPELTEWVAYARDHYVALGRRYRHGLGKVTAAECTFDNGDDRRGST